MTTTKTLYVAFELGQDKWLIACATEAAEKPRIRSLPARDLDRLATEIAKAKARFGLPAGRTRRGRLHGFFREPARSQACRPWRTRPTCHSSRFGRRRASCLPAPPFFSVGNASFPLLQSASINERRIGVKVGGRAE
jgi:hypothetical protein